MEKYKTISEQIEYLEKIISSGDYKIERKGKYWYSFQSQEIKCVVLYIETLKELTIQDLSNDNDIYKIRYKYSDYTNDDFIIKRFFGNLFLKVKNTISEKEKTLLFDISRLYEELKNESSATLYIYTTDKLYDKVEKWVKNYSSERSIILLELNETFRKERSYINYSKKDDMTFIKQVNQRIKGNIGFILDLVEDLQ